MLFSCLRTLRQRRRKRRSWRLRLRRRKRRAAVRPPGLAVQRLRLRVWCAGGAAAVAAEGFRLTHRLLLMGVSGSGKSTVGALLAEGLGVPFADADSFHPPANVAKMARGEALSDADREPWLDALGRWLAAQADGGVIGCSALKRSYRDRLRALAPELRILHLAGAPNLIASRQAGRPNHFMPASLMASQFATLEAPDDDERPIILDIAHPPAILAAEAITALKESP